MSSQGSSGQRPQNRPDEHETNEVAPEYDFSQGIRGRHAWATRDGYTMVIHHSDGTTEVREVMPRPGTVVLDPDVRAYFPDSNVVNRALRKLIGQFPQPPASSGTTK